MWYIYPLIVLFLIIIYYLFKNIRDSKRINDLFLKHSDKYQLIKVKKREYDYVLKTDDKEIYIKIAKIPYNSLITINSKETWRLSWNTFKKERGAIYDSNRYMDELINYLKNDIKSNNNVLKVIFLYKHVDRITRYLNETELDVVDINTTPCGYKITSYETFEKDLNVLLK